MAKHTSITAAEVSKAKQLRDQARKISEYRKALVIILMAECGFVAEKAAEVLGMSRRTVFRDQSDIRSQDDTRSKAWGGRRHAAMTLEDEAEFLALWKEKAAQGGFLTVPPIHAALVERVGYDLPLSTTYRLLARHGWRKVQQIPNTPRTTLQSRMNLKKTPRIAGYRLPEKHSPELNPAEQIWRILRKNYFANRVFDSAAATTAQAEFGLSEMAATPSAMRQLCNWPWISAILNA